MATALEIFASLLLLTAPIAVVAWVLSWFPLSKLKMMYLSDQERKSLRYPGDINVSFRLMFMLSHAERDDIRIRRLVFWRRVLFLWPFGVVAVVAVIFRVLNINQI